MAQDPFIAQVRSKVKHYEAELERLNEEISTLTAERDQLIQGHAAYRKILEIETESDVIGNQAQNTLKFEVPNFASLTIPGAAEVVLRESRRAMSIPDLLREIKKRGKSMEGPNVYNVLYSTLKRKSTIFKKQGSLWTLINKNQETEAA